jgi:F-type H+-transporting ATPase subunit delta
MSAVGRRYAKALFALAREQGAMEAVGEELAAVAERLVAPELRPVWTSPLFPAARRQAVLQELAARLGASPLVVRFLRLVAERGRLPELPSIAEHYRRLEDEALHRARIRIRSAAPLDPGQRERLVQAFAARLGKSVVAREEVSPELLAGVVVEAEGKVYDGSLRAQLDRLAEKIARPQI